MLTGIAALREEGVSSEWNGVATHIGNIVSEYMRYEDPKIALAGNTALVETLGSCVIIY